MPNHWSGTVTPQKAGYVLNSINRSYTDVTAGLTDQDYTGTLLTYVVSGYILESDLTPVVGVDVTADNGGGSDTTDSSGYYEITVNYGWSGSVTPALENFICNPIMISYTQITADQYDQNYTATHIADLDSDGVIDVLDLATLVQYWLNTGEFPADINGDNNVDLGDVAELAHFWYLTY